MVKFVLVRVNEGCYFVKLYCKELVVIVFVIVNNIIDMRLSICLGWNGFMVCMVEYFMFVLEGLGVDNCWIEIEGGNEVLLLDGLVWEWVEVIEEFGLFIVKDYVGFGSVWNVYVFDLFIIVY